MKFNDENQETARRTLGDTVLPDQLKIVLVILGLDWCEDFWHQSEASIRPLFGASLVTVPRGSQTRSIDHFHKWRRILLFLCIYVN